MSIRSLRPLLLLGLVTSVTSVACGDPPDEPTESSAQAQTAGEVTPAKLLEELFDRSSVSRPPAEGARFSTFMRSSRSPLGPTEPVTPGTDAERGALFARCGIELPNPCARDYNMDFVDGSSGSEVEIDRVDLPFGGVLTRFWTVIDPPGAQQAEPRTVRFFVDDDPTPLVLSIPNQANAALPFPFGDPNQPASRSVLGAVTENGIVIHTPIAFAKKLRITGIGRPASGRLYWQATYRRYEESVAITPMPTSGPSLDALAATASTLSARWSAAPALGGWTRDAAVLPGAGQVSTFEVYVPPEASESAIQFARLVVTTDGHPSPDVDVSLLDFFATALAHDGRRAIVDHQTGFVSAQNLAPVRFRGVPFILRSQWPIPFGAGARIEVRGLSGTWLRVVTTSAPPSPLRLHATTAAARANAAEPIVARVLDVTTRGVYAGTTIAVDNGTDPTWWGEGDEFIRADDALVVAGTGMEDYFGYGYSSSLTFASPLHAQTVASNRTPGVKPAPWAGPDTYDNSGLSVNTRAMVLDRIPFQRHLTFDWELLHTHYLRPFMRDAPPPGVRFNAPFTVRVVHYWFG